MMQEEALRFLDNVVASNGGIADLLTSTKAYVNADLAKIYGPVDDGRKELVAQLRATVAERTR